MKEALVGLAVMAADLVAVAAAQEPDWASMPYTSHSAFQAVDANGNGAFPTSDPVKMRGVLLNRPQDMLQGTAGTPGFMGGQWQCTFRRWTPATGAARPCGWGRTSATSSGTRRATTPTPSG